MSDQQFTPQPSGQPQPNGYQQPTGYQEVGGQQPTYPQSAAYPQSASYQQQAPQQPAGQDGSWPQAAAYPQTTAYPQVGLDQRSEEGRKHARNSVIMGIIGIFIFGIILGPLALSQARKAEELGTKATAGKVLGWIAIIGWAIVIITRFTGR